MSKATNAAWRKIGALDPYFGVATNDQYRSAHMDKAARQAFIDTGRQHVRALLSLAERHFSLSHFETALDFGCGVGRLVIPLAGACGHVTGVDISDAMIGEAQRNCSAVSNVDFLLSEDGFLPTTGRFDLVHSFAVLQHIPVHDGMQIIEQLIAATADDGLFAMHITFASDRGKIRKLLSLLRRKIVPFNFLTNIARGERWDFPAMLMADYSLEGIYQMLDDRNIRLTVTTTTFHKPHRGLFIMGTA